MKISSNVNIELTRTTKHENKMSRVQVVSQNPLRVDSSLARARDFPLLLSAQTRGMHFRPFQMAFGSFTTGGGAFFPFSQLEASLLIGLRSVVLSDRW